MSRDILFAVLLALGPLMTIHGFLQDNILQNFPTKFALHAFITAAAILAFSLLISRLLQVRSSLACAGIVIALALWAIGIKPMLAAALLVLASANLGRYFLSRSPNLPSAFVIVLGMGAIGGTVGWLLPFPLHYTSTYIACLGGLVLFQPKAQILFWRKSFLGFQQACNDGGWSASLAMTVIGIVSLATWLPTMQYDDLAYHLALPWQLQLHHYYRLDIESQIWATAPWLTDVIQSIAQLVAGEESRGAVNIVFLALLSSLAYTLSDRLQITVSWRWAVVALVISSPLLAWLLAGMQTELFLACIFMSFAVLACERIEHQNPPSIALGLLVAIAMATKLTGLVMCVPFVLWIVCRYPVTSWLRYSELFRCLLCFVLIGLSSYVYAFTTTGNPVFPLFNAVFKSPFFDISNFADGRYKTSLHPSFFYEWVFDARKFGEQEDGGFGFTWLLLLGTIPIALYFRQTRGIVLAAMLAVAIIYSQVQYLRYAFPALLVLIPGAVYVLLQTCKARISASLIATCCIVNIAFLGNANWMIKDGALRNFITTSGNPDPILEKFVPERIVAEYLRSHYPVGARVLWGDYNGPFVAELAGSGFAISWYDHELYQTFRSQESGNKEWFAQLLSRVTPSHLLLDERATLELKDDLLKHHAQLEVRIGKLLLWRLGDGFISEKIPSNHKWNINIPKPGENKILDIQSEIACGDTKKVVVIIDDSLTQQKKLLECSNSAQGSLDITFSLKAGQKYISLSSEKQAELKSVKYRIREDLMHIRDHARQFREKLL